MSSVGQALGGIVGGAIGLFVGNPLYGAQIGMMIGGAIDPPKGPTINGPRLNDLSVQTSTYGAPIPRNYGTIAQTGNIFWLQGDKLTEIQTVTESGGKGGPVTTTKTWSYYATFAVGLCQGPIDGVRRIWIGGQLWYDAGGTDMATMIASNQKSDLFTLYLGTDTQTADPLIQADKGVANTPAYRGLAYIVFDSLPLEKYSNSLMGAQVKVEVVKNGQSTLLSDSSTLPVTGWTGIAWNGVIFCAVRGGNYDTVVTSSDGLTWNQYTNAAGKLWSGIASDGHGFVAISELSTTCASSEQGVVWNLETLYASAVNWKDIKWCDDRYVIIGYDNGINHTYVSVKRSGSVDWTTTRDTMPLDDWNHLAWGGGILVAVRDGNTCATSIDKGQTWTAYAMPAAANWTAIEYNGNVFCAVGESGTTCATSPDGATWTLQTMPSFAHTCMSWTGTYFLVLSSTSVAATSPDGVNWTYHTGLTTLNALEVVWNGAWSVAVGAGSTTSIRVWFDFTEGSTFLSDIVEAECLTSNILTAGDLDVTALTDTVRGYRVAQLGAIRGALDPLRAAFPFDVVQHGYQIKFVRRGGASVATIPTSALDARAAGANPGVQVTDAREMDIMLPRKVSVNYVDITREYETNQQSYERINTDAVGERAVEMPIVFIAAEAAQTAEMLTYLYWMERHDVAFVLPPEYDELEPSDVITIVGTDATWELRLLSTNTLPDGRIECRAKYNKAAIYTPVARGEEGQSTGGLLTLAGPCVYSLLDIPLMRDDDDTAGFPVAMSGHLGGWPGGILYRSDDGGQTWTDLRAFAPGAVMGYATTILAAHGGTVYDFASMLTARLYSGTLSSVTEAQLFAGQNWFAYGADGRWEIIAARTATLQGDGSYVLQDFLRGQHGTEWATGLHAANDRIILLSATALSFISVNASSIGSAKTYRAITTGKALDSDTDLAFTYRGVNLECLSPVALTGNRHPSTNDWTLTWTRRSRYAGWRDYVDAALGETSESYEVDIYSDGTYTTLKRTLTASSATVAYTSAQQVTDFGSNQATLYVKVYQLSATVGRGYALTQSITR